MILEKLHRRINEFHKAFNWRRFRRDALHLGESLLVFGVLYGIFSTLIWGVCKAGNYIQKPDGSYQYRDTDLLGHGEASVINIQHWIHLTDKEVLAIRWHMGAYTGERDWDTLSKVYDRYPEVLCLHMADMIATHIMEVEE